MLEIDDSQLIKRYLNGDARSLEFLIKKYLKPIYGFVFSYVKNGHEAEDITQETFVKVWKNLKKFKKEKNFKTWIFYIAKNTAIDYLRKKKAVPFSAFENADGNNFIEETIPDIRPSADQIVYQNQIESQILKATEKLSADHRKVLFMRYRDFLSFKEIAGILGESINTIKSRYRRALLALKNEITE